MTGSFRAGRRLALALLTGMLVIAGCSTGQSKTPSAGASEDGGDGSARGDIGLPEGLTFSDARVKALETLGTKKVIFVSATQGIPLTQSWTEEMQATFDTVGIDFTVKDSAFDPQLQLQLIEAAISEKPDLMIVHNLDVQLTAKQLQQAVDAGIYVIQLNLQSSTMTDAYVGGDFVQQGITLGEITARDCAGKEIAYIHQAANITADIEQSAGFMQVAEEKKMKIVSEQDATYDSGKANAITAAVLKQNPNICGVVGLYDEMMVGAATAVADAGLKDKVGVYVAAAGEAACLGMKDGTFKGAVGSNGRRVGTMAAAVAQTLLESNLTPGTARFYVLTPGYEITKENYAKANVCFNVTP